MVSSRCFSLTAVVSGLLFPWKTVVGSHTPNLPWGDINVLVVTDVHSWVNSHVEKEPDLDADYGAILSFHHHLQHYAEHNDLPFFFVMNGDFMDGTGLARHPPTELVEILKRMPFDAMNIGNHELYFDSTVEAIGDPFSGIVKHFGDSYLTTNVVLTKDQTNVGFRYKMLEFGDDIKVLTFGFLYNMEDHCPSTQVEKVEDVVRSDWFQALLDTHKHHLNAVLVLCHMDLKDPLVFVILDALREALGDDMPIQFITGHTHYRGYAKLDELSTSFEAGRYLDTVGFVSFPAKILPKNTTETNTTTITETPPKHNRSTEFEHVFLDANIHTLRKDILKQGFPFEFWIQHGRSLQSFIHKTRKALGLTRVLGCTNTSLYLGQGLDEPDSLWGFYRTNVVQSFYFQDSATKVYFEGQGAFRYDLLAGMITVDDIFGVAPFNGTIFKIAEGLTGAQLRQILGHEPNTDVNPNGQFMSKVPETIVSLDSFDDNTIYELYSVDFDRAKWAERVASVTGSAQPLVPQNITVTQLWQNYVVEHMSDGCSKKMPPLTYKEFNEDTRGMAPAILGLVSLIAIGITACILGVTYRTIRRVLRYGRYNKTEATDIPKDTIPDGTPAEEREDFEII